MSVLLGKSVILSRMVQCVSYFSPITLVIYAVLIALVVIYQKKRARLVRLIEKIPGPGALPLIGNTIEINVDHDGESLAYAYRRAQWLGVISWCFKLLWLLLGRGVTYI